MLSNLDVFDPFALDDGKPAPARAAEVFLPGLSIAADIAAGPSGARHLPDRTLPQAPYNRNSASYRLVELIDGASSLRCYGWKPKRVHAPGTSEGTIVTAAFVTYEYDGSVRGRLGSLTVVADPKPEDVIATLPSALCPIPGVVDRLRTAVASIREPLLREFVARVFADYTVARRFLVPASFGDHHSRPRGSRRSLYGDGRGLFTGQSISEMNRDLAVVQSLFHDVGDRNAPAVAAVCRVAPDDQSRSADPVPPFRAVALVGGNLARRGPGAHRWVGASVGEERAGTTGDLSSRRTGARPGSDLAGIVDAAPARPGEWRHLRTEPAAGSVVADAAAGRA